jgi:hypothetical protein
MNNEMVELVEKFGILLLGWLLGLATTLVQKKSRIRTLKTALEKEIADARKWLLNSKRHLEYMIQLCVIGEISNHGPVKIPVHIYKSNFAEATLKLNEGERGSFHAIYTRIDQLNDKYDELMELNKACGDDNTKMRQLAGALELYYCNVWTTLHLIDFHLRNRKALNRVFHNAPELGEERAKEMYDEMNARLMQLA